MPDFEYSFSFERNTDLKIKYHSIFIEFQIDQFKAHYNPCKIIIRVKKAMKRITRTIFRVVLNLQHKSYMIYYGTITSGKTTHKVESCFWNTNNYEL